MITKVVMPPLGETMDEGKIIQWLKKEGESVTRGDALLEVETDKAVLEVESFGTGVLRKILSADGETIAVGTLIGIIAEPDEDIENI